MCVFEPSPIIIELHKLIDLVKLSATSYSNYTSLDYFDYKINPKLTFISMLILSNDSFILSISVLILEFTAALLISFVASVCYDPAVP